MMKEIRLINAWKNREEVIKRCKKAKACKSQFKRLVNAKTEKTFRKVLLKNLHWVVALKILDWKVSYVFNFTHTRLSGKVLYNVRLNEKYLGTDDWWIDEYGYLVMPYRDELGFCNHQQLKPPYYEYVKELQRIMDEEDSQSEQSN